MMEEYRRCRLCAHECGIDRASGERGVCRMSDRVSIARASLHMWEEPPITGTHGSGTVFFSGCSLGCVFCQNRAISRGQMGQAVDVGRLAEIFLGLQEKGAHNINLVTPTHFVPSIISAVRIARKNGLLLPIVYNTSSYETVETLRMLEGTVDIWLPDFKYFIERPAREYSGVGDYPTVAKAALAEMYRQTPMWEVDADGLLRRGIIVRVLVLPGHVANAKLSLKYLHETFGGNIRISIMSQYTPVGEDLPHPLDRTVTVSEYREVVDYAWEIGIRDAFIQEGSAAAESFIPDFAGMGL